MDNNVSLREVLEADLPIFFAYELDPDARAMAAFTSKDPTNRGAFLAHWHEILADPTTINRTIVVDGQVAGSVSSYYDDGHPEVTYWLGKHYWGNGLATRALRVFLAHANPTRPIYARAAKDNIGSLRVLEKCGFIIVGEGRGFANARGKEIEEFLVSTVERVRACQPRSLPAHLLQGVSQAHIWSEQAEEFVKRAGFVLMAQVATKDKRGGAVLLHRYLDRAEREASDERNFVKKAVNWAIREIGQHSAELNAAAIVVAQRLQASDSRAARWVGSDALRELTSPKTAQLLARREERAIGDPLL